MTQAKVSKPENIGKQAPMPSTPVLPEILTPRQIAAKEIGAGFLSRGKEIAKKQSALDTAKTSYWADVITAHAINGYQFAEFELHNPGLTDGKDVNSKAYRAYKSIAKAATTAKVPLIENGKVRSKDEVTKATKAAQDAVKKTADEKAALESGASQDTSGEAVSGPAEAHTEAASTRVAAAFALLFGSASLRAEFAADIAKVSEMIVADATVMKETKAQRKARKAAEKAEHDAAVQAEAEAAARVYAEELAALGLSKEREELAA